MEALPITTLLEESTFAKYPNAVVLERLLLITPAPQPSVLTT